jgi:NADP-dependent 3-hydroxy acid dehydrogenase YdfG
LDHFARVLAEAGASVILAGRQADKMEALQDELRKQARDCSVLVFDAQRCASIEALGPAIQDVDILVNNAGVARPAMALNQSEAQWDEVLDTNLKGLFFVAQASGRALQKHRRGGSIINIASIAGICDRDDGRILGQRGGQSDVAAHSATPSGPSARPGRTVFVAGLRGLGLHDG